MEPQLPYRLVAGLEVVRVDAHHLRVLRGTATDNQARGFIRILKNLELDVRNVGQGGRDDVATKDDVTRFGNRLIEDPAMPHGKRATFKAGDSQAGYPVPGWYYVVYLQDPSTGESTAIMTRQTTSLRLDRLNDARPSPRFTLRRHAPYAIWYNSESGLRPQICYAWPQPICIFVLAGTNQEFAALERGRSNQIAPVDLSRFVPDVGRVVRLQAIVRGVRGGGRAFVRSHPALGGDLLVGEVARAGDTAISMFEIMTNSGEAISYRVEGDVELSLYAQGFAIAQPY